MSRLAFALCTSTLGVLVLAQSAAHLVVVLGRDHLGTVLDLDRSNGVPDVVSTLVLAIGAVGAAALMIAESRGVRRKAAAAVAVFLAALALADLLHDGAHPTRTGGPIVALAVGTVVLLTFLVRHATVRARLTLAVGVCCLAASFFVNGLDRVDHWFERRRGDPVAEAQIVAKEGLELLGWGLVAIALWDVALTRRTHGAAPGETSGSHSLDGASPGRVSGRTRARRPRVG